MKRRRTRGRRSRITRHRRGKVRHKRGKVRHRPRRRVRRADTPLDAEKFACGILRRMGFPWVVRHGAPDLLVSRYGRATLVEVKMNGDRLSRVQKHWRMVAEISGLKVVVLHIRWRRGKRPTWSFDRPMQAVRSLKRRRHR